MKILGIDPGYGITGFGLVDAQRGQFRLLNCGVITTPRASSQPQASSSVQLPAISMRFSSSSCSAVSPASLLSARSFFWCVGVAMIRKS